MGEPSIDGTSENYSQATRTRMSEGETMTLRSVTVQNLKQATIQEEVFSSDEDDKVVRDTTKRKAPTDCRNYDFTATLK